MMSQPAVKHSQIEMYDCSMMRVSFRVVTCAAPADYDPIFFFFAKNSKTNQIFECAR